MSGPCLNSGPATGSRGRKPQAERSKGEPPTALRRAAALAAAALAVVAGTAGTASADDNNRASVLGVAGRPSGNDPNGADCAYGNLCLCTGPNFTGTRFDLYRCNTYSLDNWNGTGSWVTLNYDYAPIWYVKNC